MAGSWGGVDGCESAEDAEGGGQRTSWQEARRTYFNNRDNTRSANGLPPVWQVGQYWKVESE